MSNHHCEAYTTSPKAVPLSPEIGYIVGVFSVSILGTTLLASQWSEAAILPGSKNRANGQSRSHGNLGDPVISTKSSAGVGQYSNRLYVREGGVQSKSYKIVVLASEGKRSASKRITGSQSDLIVPLKSANSVPTRSRWREANRRNIGSLSGNTADALTSTIVSTKR
jgi:hypothetical protein